MPLRKVSRYRSPSQANPEFTGVFARSLPPSICRPHLPVSLRLAVIVNMVELLCTAGLPALYTQILTMHELPSWKNYLYLCIYIIAYMLDDTLLLGGGRGDAVTSQAARTRRSVAETRQRTGHSCARTGDDLQARVAAAWQLIDWRPIDGQLTSRLCSRFASTGQHLDDLIGYFFGRFVGDVDAGPIVAAHQFSDLS